MKKSVLIVAWAPIAVLAQGGQAFDRPTGTPDVSILQESEAALATEENFDILTKTAEGGDSDAQWRLGSTYRKGSKDYGVAAEWYRESANQGHVKAQHSLGLMYSRGQGVRLDHETAVEWWRKAASRGFGQAQACLGYAYTAGRVWLQTMPKPLSGHAEQLNRGS